MSSSLVVVLICCSQVALGLGCSYEGAAALREADVVANFDPKKMTGLWYEHAFADPAQVGSTCQTLNSTYDEATGEMNTDFSVFYGKDPFTILEHYVPHDKSDTTMKGVYRKSVSAPFHIPGGSLFGLTTSIIKADMMSEKSRYGMVVIYSCLSVVNELLFATRSPVISDSEYEAILSELTKRSVPGATSLKRVDWSKCNTSETLTVV